jgi:hypothetical protein
MHYLFPDQIWMLAAEIEPQWKQPQGSISWMPGDDEFCRLLKVCMK